MASEPNDISPGTIGETKAKIAKALVSEDPRLTAPEHRAELMQKIESIYDRDYVVRISFSDGDVDNIPF